MPRLDIQSQDPERYALVRAEQEELMRQYSSVYTLARLCPYCDHKVETLYRGHHAETRVKCSNCGQDVFFPAVYFRFG